MKKICSVFLAVTLLVTALVLPGIASATGPQVVTQDFESWTTADLKASNLNGSKMAAAVVSSEEDSVVTSGHALRFTSATAEEAQTANSNWLMGARITNTELKLGSTYRLTFKMYRKSAVGSDVKGFTLGQTDSTTSADTYNCYSNSGAGKFKSVLYYTNYTGPSSDSWVQVNQVWNGSKNVNIEFEAKAKYPVFIYEGKPGESLYIDDVTISEVVPVTVEFKDTAENTLCTKASGTAGNALTLPVPTKENHIFVGWFTEKTFENQFTGNVFPNESITLYAKFSNAIADTGFEAAFTTGGDSGTGTTYKQYTKTGSNDTNVHSGNGSMAFPAATVRAGTTQSASLSIIDSNIKFTKGKTYKVSFWLKRGDAISGFESAANTQVSFVETANANSWTQGIWNESYNLSVKAVLLDQSTVTDWQQYSFYFTAGKAPQAGENTYLCLAATNFKYGFYLDDILVTEAENVTVDFKDPEDYSVLSEQAKGLPGSALTLPKPTKTGFNFVGWYTDADCTVSYTAAVFPDENTTLFAKWLAKGTAGDIYREDFENRAAVESCTLTGSHPEDVAFTLVDATEVGSENIHGGNKALKYNPPVSRQGDAVTLLITDKLKVGSNYHLSIWVRRDSSVTPGNEPKGVSICQGSKNTGFSGISGEIYRNSTNLGYAGQMSSRWTEYTVTFTAKAAYLFILSNSDVLLYFDDVTVSEVFNATVQFKDTDGTKLMEDKTGLYGAKMSVAIPEKAGKSFAGWYLDENFENAANTTYFPWNDATYYAKWLNEGCFEQNFEAWPYKSATVAMSPTFQLYTAESKNDPNVYDGKHSIRFEDTATNTYAITLFDSTMGKLKRNEKYYVTVHFKPEKSNMDKYSQVGGSYHSIYYTTMKENAWTFQSQGPQGTYLPYAFYEDEIGTYWSGVQGQVTTTTEKDANGWLTMTYEITAVTDYLAMYMTINGSIYMDAITITPLPNGLIASDYENPYCEPFYNLLKNEDFTASAAGKKTVYKLELESRSDYIFSAQPKNGAKAYLAYDEAGQNKVEGTLCSTSGQLLASRLMTGFDGIFYLVIEGNATADFDYLAFFKQKYGLEKDPTPNTARPVSNYETVPVQEAASGAETQSAGNANFEADNVGSAPIGDSPATGDVGLPLLAVLSSVLAAAAVILLKGGRKA